MPRADRPHARQERSLASLDLLEMLQADARAARELRFHLRARSLPPPFRARDLVGGRGASRRKVYRHITEWKGAHIVASDGPRRRPLSWNPATRGLETGRQPSRGSGRPAERFHFVDPFTARERPGPNQLRAIAKDLGDPLTVELLSWPLRQGLRLVGNR